jgi:hypothetical protein
MNATDEDRRIDLYHLGWEDHKRGEACPSHWPERAEGWEARDRAVNVRVVEVVRLEGYYHSPVGSFD